MDELVEMFTGYSTADRDMLSAAINGDESELTRLLRNNANIEQRDHDGSSPLHWAAWHGHEGAVRLLLENNADVTARDNEGNTPLLLAASEGVLRLLLENNADIAARDNDDYSTLHWAARHGREGAMRLLLENNADMTARDFDGSSPLHWAAYNGHEGVLRLLLENNADMTARNNEGHTPLVWAARNGHQGVVRLLLENNANIEERDEEGRTAAALLRQALATTSRQQQAPVRQDGMHPELARERERRVAAEEEARWVGEQLARTREQLYAVLQAQQRSIAVISIVELRGATDGFSDANKIGRGGFGSVFRTHQPLPSLPHGGPCAVKRLDAGGMQGHAELHTEIRVLSVCWHEHLLPLVGFCLDEARPCLVYPLMAGNLESRVVDPPQGQQHFSWQERVRAIRDAMRALVYLHTPLAAKSVVLHRDVKPSNILLDAQGNAKLADVGLAREAPELQGGVSHLTTQRLIGTPGFIDPLYIQSGQFRELTDGYAMGVSLLVCLGGRPATAVVDCFSDALEGVAPAAPFTDHTAEWPPDVAEQALDVVRGLIWGRTPARRMALSQALSLVEGMADAQGLRPGIRDDGEDAERSCVICASAPRSVRFECGHALCCTVNGCAAAILQRGVCPHCRMPIRAMADQV